MLHVCIYIITWMPIAQAAYTIWVTIQMLVSKPGYLPGLYVSNT